MRATFDVDFAANCKLFRVLLNKLLVDSFVVATHGAGLVVLCDSKLALVDVATTALCLFEQLLF